LPAPAAIPAPPPAVAPESAWWQAAWAEFRRENEKDLFVLPTAPHSAAADSLSPVTRRLLAALPDTLRFTPPDTSRAGRLLYLSDRFERELRLSLPAWQAAIEARRAAAIANQRALLYGEFLLQR
jgi:hypothetical protein